MPPAKVQVPNPPPSPLPASLRNDLIGALFSQTEAIPVLQKTLLTECKNARWLDAIRQRSLQLLREDEGRSHKEVMEILVDEARGQEKSGQKDAGLNTRSKGAEDEPVDVKMPERAVKEGTKVVRDALDGVVVFEDGL